MDKLLDIPGLAARWGVSEDKVRLLVKRREIPFTRLPGGKLVRFTPEQVAAAEQAGATPAINGPLAERRLSAVPDLTHPPSGPSTPPPPSGPRMPKGRVA